MHIWVDADACPAAIKDIVYHRKRSDPEFTPRVAAPPEQFKVRA